MKLNDVNDMCGNVVSMPHVYTTLYITRVIRATMLEEQKKMLKCPLFVATVPFDLGMTFINTTILVCYTPTHTYTEKHLIFPTKKNP